jgi:hypothetical protein
VGGAKSLSMGPRGTIVEVEASGKGLPGGVTRGIKEQGINSSSQSSSPEVESEHSDKEIGNSSLSSSHIEGRGTFASVCESSGAMSSFHMRATVWPSCSIPPLYTSDGLEAAASGAGEWGAIPNSYAFQRNSA